MLSMPRHWVFVCYEDGTEVNVMNTDTLDKDDVEWCKANWGKKRISHIELRSSDDTVLTREVI